MTKDWHEISRLARWQESEIVVNIAQFSGMDFIEFHFVIDWRQREQILKLEIPTALGNPKFFAKDRRAEELQTPAEYVMDSVHRGTNDRGANNGSEGWEQSFLEVTPSNVWVLAIKRAENSQEETILRIQERSGRATKAALKSSALGLDHSIDLAPWELKTLSINSSNSSKGNRAEVHETPLLET